MTELPGAAADVRAALLEWFDAHARELPWRGSDDPYAVLVSEIMSQQTRIETVRDYWTRWMQAFPTIEALAAASIDDVMKLWAGLGYYRRARNLHACAMVVADAHAGRLPTTAEELRALPGIGPYTAAAVASMVHGEVVSAIDGNLSRVLARLGVVEGEPTRAIFRHAITALSEDLIDPDRPGSWNEAMMDLGARICTPRNPDCDVCPIATWCEALREGEPSAYPWPKKRKPPRPESRYCIVPVRDDRVFIRLGDEQLLGGLWEFPTYDASMADALTRAQDEHRLVGDTRKLGEVEHLFSHIRMTYHVVRLDVVSAEAETAGGRWVPNLTDEAVSTAMRRVAALLEDSEELRGAE